MLMLVCRISPKNWSVFFFSWRVLFGSIREYCFGTVMQGCLQEMGMHEQFLLSMKHCRQFHEHEWRLGRNWMRVKNSLSASYCDHVTCGTTIVINTPDQPFETLISWRPLPDRLPQLAAVPVKKLERDYLLKADVQPKILHIISHYCT